MIRFMLGLLCVMGAVGGLEQNTATWTQFFVTAGAGIALMLWALPKLASEA
jgi:choline-glycine betaine transporter